MSYHVGFIPDGDGGGFFSFLQKSNSMLSPDELEVGLLELQAFIDAKSHQVEDQVSHSPGTKTGNDCGSRLSLMHLLNGYTKSKNYIPSTLTIYQIFQIFQIWYIYIYIYQLATLLATPGTDQR